MLIAMSFSLFGLSSCKKEEETAKEKIQDKDYYMTNLVSMVNDSIVESYNDLETCEKDNIFRLNSNSTGYFDEGISKCDPSDPQKINFTWSLTNNDTKLNINFFLDAQKFDILENNGTTLRLYFQEVDSAYTYSSELTFTKK